MTAALRYFSDHIEHVIGGLVVLFLLTSILLLIRNINQKEQSVGGSGRTGDDLDIGAIEAAMKRVLAVQGIGALTAAASTGGDATADTAQLTQAIQERDSKLQELAREIDRLNSEVTLQKSSVASEGGAVSEGKVAELQSKIEELQARLSEYEIIEDDIADLSFFKEENAQLKAELERMRSEAVAAPVAPVTAPAEAAVAPPASVAEEHASPEADALLNALVEEAQEIAKEDSVTETVDDLLAQVDVAAPGPASATVSQNEIDKLFALAPVDAVQPAQVVEEDASKLAATAAQLSAIARQSNEASEAPNEADNSVFNAALDTEKMLSEVESLGEGNDAGDVLADSLDTEKLLAEMSSIGTDEKKPVPAVAPALAEPMNLEEESVGEDDLLAEFKDPTDGGQR